MASIRKHPKSAYWFACFTLPDGRRTTRSTGTTDRSKALQIALQHERTARLAKEQRLTVSRARQTIADIYALATDEVLPNETAQQYFEGWLARKKPEVSERSYEEYESTANGLLTFLEAKADRPMDAITLADLAAYRNDLAKRLAAGTVNKNLKILRVAWACAVKDGLLRENVMARLDQVKKGQTSRRSFTMPELGRILEAAGDSEWRGLVLFGLYTGQRLGDLARLSWQNIDLQKGEMAFTARKTGRYMNIPLATPLREYLLTLPAPDDPKVPVFSQAASVKRISQLSNAFYDLMSQAGLVTPRTHKRGTGKGREAKREVSGMSFHCLRHTATSLLKNAGVSDVVAREIIGHDSEDVSRIYTHIESATLASALNKLPNITKSQA